MSMDRIFALALAGFSLLSGYWATMSIGAAMHGVFGAKIPGGPAMGQTPEERDSTVRLAIGLSRVLVVLATGAGICAGLLFARG